ncbi:MAG: N-acetyltransferase family protein [Bacteriovoracia bacterium]
MIRLLKENEADLYVQHQLRLYAESGRDGDILFEPYSVHHKHDPVEMKKRAEDSMKATVGSHGWRRFWALEVDGIMRGDISLGGSGFPATSHRVQMGMGIERAFRGQGHGKRMIQTVINWSQEQKFTWLDLRVFGHNTPARALYQKMGFSEVGTMTDLFRIDEQSIDDVMMVLKL